MKRNIVILNGSPRRKGNTAALVAAFTQGAEAAGHQVTTFFLEELDLHGCRGCFGGHSSQPCPCVQKDDMAKIYPAVKASDGRQRADSASRRLRPTTSSTGGRSRS